MNNIESIKKKLKTSQDFLSEVDTYISTEFKIPGKSGNRHTIKEWKEYFLIEIPKEIVFQTLVDLFAEIGEKYQRAAYFRDIHNVTMAVLEENKVDQYNSAYQEARTINEEKFGKPLAAESCKIAATIVIKSLEGPAGNQKVIRDFWIKTCDTLIEMRKLVEGMGYALSGDAKMNRDFIVKGD